MEIPELPKNPEIWRQTLGWSPAPKQELLFQTLYEQVLAGNRQFNLTRITEPTEFWEKHLWDSLSGVAPWLSQDDSPGPFALTLPTPNPNVIDIGAGAGFPGIPTAIAKSDWRLTLLDSTRKKVKFLTGLCQRLSLQNAIALAERAETLGRQPPHRESYDIALMRALGPATTCAEYALPLLKQQGLAILYRGKWSPDEADELQAAAQQLGGAIEHVQIWSTPLTQSVRHCLYLRKVAPTPDEFPRMIGVPSKQPLGKSFPFPIPDS
ncbi:MAG: 16S rRNA (guanine(527)-N(7))-methyltransferase RsmG [Leptolyngbyaceae cyanobacterium MO_188.B28]|nr:16S rRNA (guanine(527)-N(7))-methyltransferase RsmG [Leptolyngbyaceae cyanobacterium MO_188.B28]